MKGEVDCSDTGKLTIARFAELIGGGGIVDVHPLLIILTVAIIVKIEKLYSLDRRPRNTLVSITRRRVTSDGIWMCWVVLARHGLSERQISSDMIVTCVFGGRDPKSGLARHSQGRFPGVSQPAEIRAPLITPHLFDRRTLAMGSFIDIMVGQDWSGNTRLRTPLQRTVIQRGLPPR